MRRIRVSALLATLVATVALTVGTALAGSPAVAAPQPFYPPPPPVLTVNKGVVKYGVTIKLRGYRYAQFDRVRIVVRFKPKRSNRWTTVRTGTVRANSIGWFSAYLRMARAGTVYIQAYSNTNRTRAAVTVFVIDKRNGHGGWTWRTVAYTGDTASTATSTQPVQTTAAPAHKPADQTTAGMAAAGLAVIGLAGSVLVTRRVRRRRNATIAG